MIYDKESNDNTYVHPHGFHHWDREDEGTEELASTLLRPSSLISAVTESLSVHALWKFMRDDKRK